MGCRKNEFQIVQLWHLQLVPKPKFQLVFAFIFRTIKGINSLRPQDNPYFSKILENLSQNSITPRFHSNPERFDRDLIRGPTY